MAYRPRSTDGEIVYYLVKDADNAQGWVEIPYEVEYTYSPGCEAYISGPPENCYPAESPEIEILKIWKLDEKGEKRVAEVPEKDWAAEGFDKETLKQVEDKISDAVADMGPDDGPEYEPDDRDESVDKTPVLDPALGNIAWQVGTPPVGGQQESSGPTPFKYRINNPGHPAHDLEYTIWYTLSGPKSDTFASGNQVDIEYITRAGDDSKKLPEAHWEKFGFTADELDAVKDAINDAVSAEFVKHGPQEDRKKLAEGLGEFSHSIERPEIEYVFSYTTAGDKVEINEIAFADDPDKAIPKNVWPDLGVTPEELDRIASYIQDPDADPPRPPTGKYEGTIEGADVDYVVSYTVGGRDTPDTFNEPGDSIEIELGDISLDARNSSPIPPSYYGKLGITKDVLSNLVDAAADNARSSDDGRDWDSAPGGHDDYEESQGPGKWARTKGGVGDWPAGTEVTILRQTRNADGSRDILLQGPGGKTTNMSLDHGEDPGQYLELLNGGNSMGMEEMRGLAGLPVKQVDGNIKVTEADRAVQKDWRRMAINPSKNLMETSETTGGAIVPANFVFPDLGALLGYTQQKLPVTLLRSIDRMTAEGQNTMALMLNELQKLKPAADQLVEIFAGIVDGIDKFDAGSIEGREVARVFRYMMDAARFTQGGAELTEQL